MVALVQLDKQLTALTERHPGWSVWFVPLATGGIRWCARREPSLSCDSPEHLSEAIAEAEALHAAESARPTQ